MHIEELQAKLGGMSRYQWIVVISASLLSWTEMMNQTAVFFSAVPDYRCRVSFSNKSEEEELFQSMNLTAANETKWKSISFDEQTKEFDICHVDNDNTTRHQTNSTGKQELIGCDKYVYDTSVYGSTAITEWDLVCDRRYLDTIAIVMYYCGVGVASLYFGSLADWLGRKLAMLILAANIVLCGILSSVIQSFEVYVFFRFMVGMSDTTYMVLFAYVVEVTDEKSKSRIENFVILFSSLAHLALPGVAHALRDWRKIGLVASLVPCTFFVAFLFIPESPRWQLTVGKEAEAKKFFEKCAKSNKTEFNDEDWNSVVLTEVQKRSSSRTQKHSVLDLFRRRHLRMITLNMMYNWFVIMILFEGLILNVGNLAGDPYLNATLNAAVEVASFIMYAIIITRVNKKRLFLCGFLAAAGVCCLASMLLFQFSASSSGLQMASTGLAITGKFFVSASYAFSFVLANELFPTIIRGTGMAAASIAARIGAIIMPFILIAQEDVSWLTQTIFGTLALSAAAASLLFPDTSAMHILSSIDEAERYFAENMQVYSSWSSCRHQKHRESETIQNVQTISAQ